MKSKMMKAVVTAKYGNHTVLKYTDVEKPVPGKDEVLIKVRATSINDWDWALITGIPWAYRIFSGLFQPRTKITGSDIAGTVIEVGQNVTQFKAGDHVYGDLSTSWGGFAEFVCAKENQLIPKPDNMPFQDAAAIPQAGVLALQGLLDYGKIKKGQKILINGAGGGVGTIGVQIAKQYNCEVTGVDNTSKQGLMKEIGFDHVIDYTQQDFSNNGEKYDLILDNKSTRSLLTCIKSLKPCGLYITTGGNIGRILETLFLGPLISRFSKKKIKMVMHNANKDLNYFNKMYRDGKLKLYIDKPFKLEDTPEAFRIYGKMEHKGKLVITVSEEG